MKQTVEIAAVSSLIHASPEKVWKTLVTPSLIKKYLFNTNAQSDWHVGSTITFTGDWKGKRYHAQGRIISIQPNTLLRHTIWSPNFGNHDKPENHVTITYTIEEKGELSELVITQSGVKNEEELHQLENNWKQVLESIRKTAESL